MKKTNIIPIFFAIVIIIILGILAYQNYEITKLKDTIIGIKQAVMGTYYLIGMLFKKLGICLH